jgi:hypothetical protein
MAAGIEFHEWLIRRHSRSNFSALRHRGPQAMNLEVYAIGRNQGRYERYRTLGTSWSKRADRGGVATLI